MLKLKDITADLEHPTVLTVDDPDTDVIRFFRRPEEQIPEDLAERSVAYFEQMRHEDILRPAIIIHLYSKEVTP